MTDLGSILLGYALVLGGMASYAAYVIRKGRKLASQLPDEDKPWA